MPLSNNTMGRYDFVLKQKIHISGLVQVGVIFEKNTKASFTSHEKWE
jgi:hypothetical protein